MSSTYLSHIDDLSDVDPNAISSKYSMYMLTNTGDDGKPIVNMIKNCVYTIPCSLGKVYKGETCRPLKIRQEEYRKAAVRSEIEKLGKVDHIGKEKGNYLPLWDKVKIIDSDEHWRIRFLKESAHMLGYSDLLSRPSREINTIWEPIIKKVR